MILQNNNLELPNQFKKVEYIESTGTQYIRTNYLSADNTRIELTFKDNTINSYESYFGCDACFRFLRSDISQNVFAGAGYKANGLDLSYKRTLIFDADGIYENGKFLYERSPSDGSGIISEYPLLIFQSSLAGKLDKYGSYYFYEMKIYEDNILKLNLIPCYRKLDGEIGVYDLVNSVFYTNQGSGKFLKGDDV